MKRREFVKSAAFVGGYAALASRLQASGNMMNFIVQKAASGQIAYPLAQPQNIVYSTCLQCHTGCTIKVKILNGIAVKIDGNPYSPMNMIPQLPYSTSPTEAAKFDGKLCPKGESGIQTLYDPYRLRKVLKRDGPRGSNRWKVISFEQAINEIVNGGYLFKHVKGEENRYVHGLKEIYKLRDPAVLKNMKKDAALVARKKMSISEFKIKYAKYLNTLISPDHPDLGPVNNQLVFMAGRIEHGRKEFAKRWLNDAFGSVNFYEHTTICEQSHHIAYKAVTRKYIKGKWVSGKEHMKPDALNSEFIIYWGTGAFEANFGPTPLSEKVTEGIATGRLKIAVIDPRLSKTAARAWKWLPVRPGYDAALALGMIRWILENRRYDENYLRAANKTAAKLNNETTWTNATYLVKIEKDGPGALLRAKDLGIGDEHTFVVISNGKPTPVKPESGAPVIGEPFYSGKINGIKVKTVFQILKEEAFAKSLDEWATLSGVTANDIAELASEFTSHGKKAAIDFYRGPVQHPNGYYNGYLIIVLNLLIGNPDWKGGLSGGGGHWHEMGNKRKGPFNLKAMHPGKLGSFGIKLTREKSKYEDSTLFSGYPAKRPWFPFTGNVYQEILPSAADGYPYKIKALILHKGTPAFAAPAANKNIEILKDLDAIPLFIACDIVVGETSMYADYIFPDTAIWERWGTPHITPDVPTKTSKVRQPTVTPLTEVVSVFGEKMHLSLESMLLAIAEKLHLPGYGKDGLGKGWDFKRPEDFYLKMVANIAAGDKVGEEVPDASFNELKIFRNARKHLDSATFNEKRWIKAVGQDWWKKVVYVLNRGGRFEDFTNKFIGNGKLVHKFGRMFNIYYEPIALARNPMTGKRFSGIGTFKPIADVSERPIKDSKYPLFLITYKEIFGGQSRTIGDYWMTQIYAPENYVYIHPSTARKYNLQDGDIVKIVSATNPEGIWDLKNGQKIPVAGKVKTTEGVRKDVVAVSWSYGHWAYGANDIIVDGKVIKGDRRRATGICPNAVMRVDPVLKNVSMEDVIGGSASYYDTKVELVRI